MRTHLASLVEDFRRHAAETAVVAHRGIRRYRTTYGELALLAGRFAAELDRLGMVPGERVVIWGANSAEWMAAFFGCLLRAVIAVPLDAAGSADFSARVVKDVAPKLIIGDRNLLRAIPNIDNLPHIELSKLGDHLPQEPNFAVSESVTAQTPFQIVFTSGTTSEPKGIVHTHANVLASSSPIEREMAKFRFLERLVHPIRFLHTLPLSHVFGQFMGLWLPPLLPGEIHFTDQVEARRLTELIRHERISVLVAVPRVLQLLRTHLLKRFEGLAEQMEQGPESSRLRRWWRFRRVRQAFGWKFWAVISGGAAVPLELETFWHKMGIGLIQGYGMTETTALVTLNYPFKISQGSIGKTLPGREVRLSEDGEILVRGDMLATATWQGGGMRQREGEWLATGDLGERDERGELRFLGRKGDMIVTGAGMNVHPDDLEAAMKKQPGIRECVVIPFETSNGVEPVAVVLSSGNEAQLHDALLAANRELADFQQIRRALQWPEPQFPFTSTGKLLRRKVAEWASQSVRTQRQSDRNSAQTGKDLLLDLIAEVTGEPSATDDDSLRLTEDLHLDSLGRVQLQTALEQRLDRELPDDALANIQTLGDLRAIVSSAVAPELPQTPTQMPAQVRTASVVADTQAVHETRSVPAEDTPAPENRAPGIPDNDLKSLTSEPLYPKWPLSWPFAMIRGVFLELLMRPLVWLLGAPRIVRLTGEIPNGPLLVIANHRSAYDGALVLYALPGKLRRRVAIAMSGEMLLDYRIGRNQGNFLLNLLAPPQYWLVTALFNVFPMPRMHGFRKSFQHAGEAMDRGYSVLIFPEGARYHEGEMRPFRQGIGLIGQEAQIPILPVTLVGLDEMYRTRWFRSRSLEIRIGKIIPVDETTDPAELTAKLESAVRDLCS
ncbi:AMP-binding protein [Acidicapsa acidisoli]|uniref:AMP-binding protein n=1 Tax=Acidicapsa acidisoli TaxID=1615681 RepID=UPI0021E00660|nr:AMP-binding protein [Acidicapsa acidisoli]